MVGWGEGDEAVVCRGDFGDQVDRHLWLKFLSRDDDSVGVMVCLWTVIESLMSRITVGIVSSVV